MNGSRIIQFSTGETEGANLHLSGESSECCHVQAIDDGLIRIWIRPDGAPRQTKTWLINSGAEMPEYAGRDRSALSFKGNPSMHFEVTEDGFSGRDKLCQFELNLAPFGLRWLTREGSLFAEDLSGHAYICGEDSPEVFHYLSRRPDELYYGLGETSGALNKRGRRFRLTCRDALGYDAETSDPLYKHYSFYITFVPELQIFYGLLYDNLASGVMDLGCEIHAALPDFRYYRADQGDLDYYFIYGPTLEAVLAKLRFLTGSMALPPRWSLGVQGSAMVYTEAKNASERLKHFPEQCREHDIPCDLFHLSSGYTSGTDGKRYVFTWNESKIPDPKKLVQSFSEAGIHVCANIKPALLTTHPLFEERAAKQSFIQKTHTDAPQCEPFWGGSAAHLDFTNSETRDWWKEQIQEQLLAHGIDSLWNDNNEFVLADDNGRYQCGATAGEGRQIQTLLMARASWEALSEARPNQRPFLISRSGCPGIQRFAQTWSGDNTSTWKTLRWNIPMGLSLGLSGMPNTGHAVGGLYGEVPDAELLVRWIQNGIFHPRFCMHSWNENDTATEPWMLPEVLPIVRDLITFRYRLIPYLYTLMHRALRYGAPLIRPLVYHYPQDRACWEESFDFMLGSDLLVASVLEPDVRRRSVYLPNGSDWYHFYTGEFYSGGQTVEVRAPLEEIPLFARAGSCIPFTGSAAEHMPLRHVYAFPEKDSGRASGLLIEDDGVSLDYQLGMFSQLNLSVNLREAQLHASAQLDIHNYALPYTEMEFVFPQSEEREVAECETDEQGRIRTRVVLT